MPIGWHFLPAGFSKASVSKHTTTLPVDGLIVTRRASGLARPFTQARDISAALRGAIRARPAVCANGFLLRPKRLRVRRLLCGYAVT